MPVSCFCSQSMIPTVDVWKRILTPPIFTKIIDVCLEGLFNWKVTNCNSDEKQRFYYHLYSTTSVKVVAHWFQILWSGRFQHYNAVSGQGYNGYNCTPHNR
eukprot:Filipodium_phascolosomae@DN2596_c0_g1_i20.p1